MSERQPFCLSRLEPNIVGSGMFIGINCKINSMVNHRKIVFVSAMAHNGFENGSDYEYCNYDTIVS